MPVQENKYLCVEDLGSMPQLIAALPLEEVCCLTSLNQFVVVLYLPQGTLFLNRIIDFIF
jgi:hypothetical protein